MTTYTNVFGGNTIRPADVSFSELALTSNQTLSWPGQGSSPFTSAIVEVTPDAPGRWLRMPDARRAGKGESVTFKNTGAHSFALQDNVGGSIVTVASGTSYTVYLRSNTTAAGSWSNWQAGAGTSSADAGALDGAGLEAASGLLRVRMNVNSFAIPQAFSDGDRGSMAVWTGGSGTFTVPSAASVGEGWFMFFKNDGSGTLQIASPASETFSGDADVTLISGESAIVSCDGVNFSAIVATDTAATSDFSYTSISVAGTGTYTLSAAEYSKVAIKFTGTLTGNRTIIVPDAVRDYWINNATTGAFTLTVKTLAGAGVAVTQGKKATLYSDGTDIIAADTDYPSGISTPVSVANGGTGATIADTALTNLGGTTTGKSVFTAASAAAGRSALSAAASGANTDITSILLNNTGLRVRDTDASHGLSIVPGSNLSADRTLTVTTGDADRTLNISAGNVTISSAGAALIDDADADAQRTTLGLGTAAVTNTASTTEVLTGTATDRAVTPDALAAIWEQGTDVASASVVSLGEGGYFTITGTTTITDIDLATDKAGRRAIVRFAGALTLTHSASTLILPGGANITTAAGDVAEFVSEGADVVRCVSYTKANGRAVVEPAGGAWVKIGSYNPSSAASLEVTNLSAYRALRATFMGIIPSTDETYFRFEYSTNNGSSYTGSTDVNGNAFARDTSQATDAMNSDDGTETRLTPYGFNVNRYIGNAATDGRLSGFLYIENWNQAAHMGWQSITTFGNSSGSIVTSINGGVIKSTTARDAIRFIMQSGNLSGHILLEGYIP